jgi:hypothetical protein
MIDSLTLDDFDRDGYVVVRDLLCVERDLRPVIDEYDQVLDRLADGWIREGRLSSMYSELPFSERLMRIVIEAEPAYDLHFDISLPQADITDETPMHHGPAVFELLRSPRLLDAVEQFVGPEIYSNPVQHTRIKLPEDRLPAASRTGLTAQIAWHQDLAVVIDEADNTEMLTVWFPLTKATVENGCLAVVPGSHKQELSLHCRSRNPLTIDQVSIPESLLDDDFVTLPMQPGDVLFMHRRTQHSGLPNRSGEIRWSFDLRYHPIGQATGRPWFPGFIARSKSQPESELRSSETWAESWRAARHELAHSEDVTFNRWKQGDPRCA